MMLILSQTDPFLWRSLVSLRFPLVAINSFDFLQFLFEALLTQVVDESVMPHFSSLFIHILSNSIIGLLVLLCSF